MFKLQITSSAMEVSAEFLTLQNDNFMERHVKFYKKIREEEDMFDVSIACDGAEVRAHKLIMSASSPLFKRIIKSSNHPDPYIFLKDLHPQDLTSIVNFVYTGETKVEANSIQRFMSSALDLQISGLVSEAPQEDLERVETEVREETVKTPSRTKKTVKRKSGEREREIPLEITKCAKQEEHTATEEEEEEEDTTVVTDFLEVKEEAEVEDDPGRAELSTNTVNGNDTPNEDVNDALEKEIEKRMEKIQDKSGQKLTKCTVCGKTFKQKSKAKFHIETHVEGFSHTCTICGATAKTKKSLSVHIYNRHTKANKQQD